MSKTNDPTLRSLNNCGCCKGISTQTPIEITNRPGLTAIAYRVGTHAQFKQSMLARISGSDIPVLSRITVRSDDDFTIALLDAWAMVADILTFYQERIANEFYLHTATERISILYLARLIGYELRPGVAASTYMAFTLEDTPDAPQRVTIDIGTKVQSIPGQDEQAQIFETTEKIEARAEWNEIKIRLTKPQIISTDMPSILLEGNMANLKQGDWLLIVTGTSKAFRRIKSMEIDSDAQLTSIIFDDTSDANRQTVSQSLCGDGVYSFDVRASLFGYNAPDWNLLSETVQQQYAKAHGVQWPTPDWPFVPPPQNQLNLDAVYSQIIPNSWVVVIRDDTTIIGCLLNTIETGFSSFGLSFKITQLTLDIIDGSTFLNTGLMSELRKTTIYAQSEKLTLAELPVDAIHGHIIELDRQYEGLKPGQIIVVSGECIDSPCEEAPELAVLSETLSTPENRTTLILTKDLKHIYKPETVKINANIARATHGETVQEVLGSGDASQSYQHFALRQPPLTYISAPTPSGAESTLKIRVNDLLWHEVSTLYGCDSSDRVFVTRTNDDGKTTVQFGDGKTGLRLPTGQESVRATYRKGIGLAGNVGADQLSLLMTRPLGVKGVTNPQAANGAADRESLGNARQNAPLTVLTLDRIVSLKDYEDFARAFAGLAKTLASWTWDGQTRGVFMTVAGPKGAEISPNSDLYKNLLSAMQKSGDPYVHVRVESYRKTLFRLAVRVKVNPDYRSEQVLVAVEQALRSHFSFDTRDFGQPVTLSEVMAVIQAVPGVQAVDVDKLYRYGQEAKLNPILAAAVPQVGAHATVSAAELLTLDLGPLDDLGVMQ